MRTPNLFPLALAVIVGVGFFAKSYAEEATEEGDETFQDAGAHGEDVPGETLSFDVDGNVEVNGAKLGDKEKGPMIDLYADVAKVMEAPDGNVILFLSPVEARKTNYNGTTEKMPVKGEARPFGYESSWKMFDAEGEETDDPRFALRVILPYEGDMNAAMFDVKWNECQGSITGNYTGLKCNKNRFLADEYVAFLNKYFLGCVNQGVSAVNLPAAVKAHITHDGTSGDARHSPRSLHASGRAVDIQKIETLAQDGTKSVFDFRITSSKPKSASRAFYEKFRQCWHNIQVSRKCPKRKGGHPIGTIGWEDKNHKGHHLHTSMPFCPKTGNHYVTSTEK